MYIIHKKRDYKLLEKGYPICHGGVHGYSSVLKRYVRENSLFAINVALMSKIPVECDIRFSSDGIAILSHNDELSDKNGRVILEEKDEPYKISKHTYNEISKMVSVEDYPSLDLILKIRVSYLEMGFPCILLIDVKYQSLPIKKGHLENFCDLLNQQEGEIGVQSFNPFWMLALRKKLKKDILTIQLVCKAKTLIDTFHPPIILANIYEKWISCVCVIARTDAISMELHNDAKWVFHTRFFHSDEITKTIQEINLENITNKIQRTLISIAKELTGRKVLAWTVRNETDLHLMDSKTQSSNPLISNFVYDYSELGFDNYMLKIQSILYEDVLKKVTCL